MILSEGGVWGMVVAIVSFLAQAICFGTMSCIGLYTIPFLEEFDATNAEVSLVGSINYAVAYMTGPIGSLLLSWWSHRQVALLGALLTNIGLLAMPFAPNLTWMYIFYGICVGLGLSLMYMPSHILCALYYCERRGVVTAVVSSGCGCGLLLMPHIADYFIAQYGWRISFFAIAAINMSLIPFAALLRPVDDTMFKQNSSNSQEKLVDDTLSKQRSSNSQEKLVDDTLSKQSSSNSQEKLVDETPKNSVERMGTLLKQSASKYQEKQVDETPKNSVGTMGNRNIGQVNNGYEYIASTGEVVTKDQIDVENNIHTNNEVLEEGQSKMANGVDEVGDEKQLLTSESKTTWTSRWQSFLDEIRPLLQFDFIVFSFGCMCWVSGCETFVIFVPAYAVSVGVTDSQASMQLSIYGVTFTIGCVVIGLILNNFKQTNVLVVLVCTISGGAMAILATVLVPHSFWGLSVISVAYGLPQGCFWGAVVDIMADLVGVQYLGNAYGMVVLAIGLGTVSAPPIAGMLVGKYESIEMSMYVSGIVVLLGAVAVVIVRIRRQVRSD